jgi:acyl-CoA thioesterase FadM
VMVWAATWAGKRFCVCGGMEVRFRHSARVGEEVIVSAELETTRSKIIRTKGWVTSVEGKTLCTASATYVALPLEKHRAFVETLVDEPDTARALSYLKAEQT